MPGSIRCLGKHAGQRGDGRAALFQLHGDGCTWVGTGLRASRSSVTAELRLESTWYATQAMLADIRGSALTAPWPSASARPQRQQRAAARAMANIRHCWMATVGKTYESNKPATRLVLVPRLGHAQVRL